MSYLVDKINDNIQYFIEISFSFANFEDQLNGK